MSDPDDLPERFQSKIQVSDDGCWLWTGARTRNHYGQTIVDGRQCGAHRATYELLVGPIAPGLSLDHLCRVRYCVNPDHLEPVTNRENILRGASGSAQNARKTHCIRGHAFNEENTYNRPGYPGRACRICQRGRTNEWYHRQKLVER